MSDREPATEQPFNPGDPKPTPWAEARRHLENASTYWLATVRPGGRPHAVPVLAVWLDGALHFVANESSRKAKNLGHRADCILSASTESLDLVVEGEAVKVRDDAKLKRVADVYASKYGWTVTVREGAFFGEGAPTAGPPPTTSTKSPRAGLWLPNRRVNDRDPLALLTASSWQSNSSRSRSLPQSRGCLDRCDQVSLN